MKNLLQILLIVVSFNAMAQTDSIAYFGFNSLDTIITTTLPGVWIGTSYLESDKDIASEQLRAYTKECLQDSIVFAYEIRYGIRGRLFSDEIFTVYVDSANMGTLNDFTHFIIREIIIPKEVTLEGFQEYLNREQAQRNFK